MFQSTGWAAPGELDTTFDTDGIVITDLLGANLSETGRAVALQPDGKILVAGRRSTTFALARYTANGSLDTSFGTNGVVVTPMPSGGDAQDLVVQPDDKILVAGTDGNFDFAVVRYEVDGSLDTTFGTNGIALATMSATKAEARGIALGPDGKITVVGYAETSPGNRDYAVARFDPDGSPDTAFDTDGKVTTEPGTLSNDFGQAVALQSDGKIVVAGQVSGITGVVRYNVDGSLDTTFDTDGIVTTDVSDIFGSGLSDDIYAVAVQPDGKIVVAGSAGSGVGSRGVMLVRYDTDGSLDGSVVEVLGPLYQAFYDVAVQPDGKIVAAGEYVGTPGAPNDFDFVLMRFNANLGLDTSFDIDGIAVLDLGSTNEKVDGLAIQPDGKIVVAGSTANDFAVVRYDGFTLDVIPDSFIFNDETDVGLSQPQTSNIVTVGGLDPVVSVSVPVSVTGGEYTLDGGTTYTSGVNWVTDGDQVDVQHISASTNDTMVSTTLRIGGVMASNGVVHLGATETVSDSFDTTTMPLDNVAPTAVLELRDVFGRPVTNGEIGFGEGFRLLGQGSTDVGGQIVEWRFTRVSGTGGELPLPNPSCCLLIGMTVGETVVSPNGVLDIQPVNEFFDVGEHRIQLQVVDSSGNVSAPVEITVRVIDNIHPIALLELRDVFGRPVTNREIGFGEGFRLLGQGSTDVGGQIVEWRFTRVSGTGGELPQPNPSCCLLIGMTVGETVVSPNGVLDIQPVNEFFDVGEHRFQLQVVDDSGNVSPTEEITMTIVADNSGSGSGGSGSGGSSIDLMFLMFLAVIMWFYRYGSQTIGRD